MSQAASDASRGGGNASPRPLIGFSSPAIPRELLSAAGCSPCFLGNSPTPTTERNRFFEVEFFDDRSYQIFGEVNSSEGKKYRALVLSRTSEKEYKLFLYFRELVRLAKIPATAPEIEIFNLLHSEGDCVRAYASEQVKLLWNDAKKWSGKNSGDAELGAAIRAYNKSRQALSEALKLRSEAQRATGSAVVELVSAFYSLDPLEFVSFAKSWGEKWATQPKLSGPRILLLGENPPGGVLHSFIESEKAVVGVEDHWLGERAAMQAIPESQDALSAITDYYMKQPITPRHHSRPQSELWIMQILNRFDGAVIFHSQSDCVEGWDYPWQARLLTENNKPFVRLHDLSETSKNTFKAFLEKLS